MNCSWTIGLAVIGSLLLGGCEKSVTTAAPQATNQLGAVPAKVQPKLPTIKVWLGSQELVTEVARTDLQSRDLTPQETKPIESATDRIQFVIETTQGSFDRNKVSTGTVVRTEIGSL